MLTLDKLKYMNPGIFKKGYGFIDHPWPEEHPTNIREDGTVKIKWVAVRGGIHDWSIYSSLCLCPNGTEHLGIGWIKIAKLGEKITNKEVIQKLVPCTDEAFKMYRY